MRQNNIEGPIERLLIVHLTLTDDCTGHALDEDASEAELVQSILYYYDSTQQPRKSPCHNTQQHHHHHHYHAIQFAGLCTALFRLPQSMMLQDDAMALASQEKDGAQVVYLEKSALLFCPLEDDVRILAVAQISTTSAHSRATPTAIRWALSRAHEHFCLFRGGGIHRRLQQRSQTFKGASMNSKTPCIYPGMDEFYRLQKRLRRRTENHSRDASPKSAQHEVEIRAMLEDLQDSLPINALCNDLRVHYDDFCGEMATRSYACFGACRNVVEGIPPPIAVPTGEHLLYSASVTAGPSAIEQLMSVIHNLLRHEGAPASAETEKKFEPHLIGATVFIRGQLMFPTTTWNDKETISNETATKLMGYMAHFRFQTMYQLSRDTVLAAAGSTTPPRKATFRPFALSFVADDMEDPLPQVSPTVDGFLAPPPLSFLSALDEPNGFQCLSKEGLVWAPPVCMPVTTGHEITHLDARICLYSRGVVSVLLYFSRADPEGPTSYQTMFHDVEGKLASALVGNSSSPDEISNKATGSLNVIKHVITKVWQVQGQEVIVIDRVDQSLLLFADPRHNDEGKVHERPTRQAKNRSEQLIHSTPPAFESCSSSPLGLDCRYRLASQLSLDSLLAFDDAMDEIHQSNRDGSHAPYEICTLLSNRWVYAFAQDQKELYAIFDSAFFVTVADVQHAAQRIRTELMGTRQN